jgi:hypothetical protein
MLLHPRPSCSHLVTVGLFASLLCAVPTATSPTFREIGKRAIYEDSTQPIPDRVADLLSRMSFLEQLAQTRNVGGILGADASFDNTTVFGFNDGLGGGSICNLRLS